MQLFWNSLKGYSRPNELVDVLERKGSLVNIRSGPDDGEPASGFYYWVHESELSASPRCATPAQQQQANAGKCTPGPWQIEVTEDAPNGLVIAPGSETVIAEIQSNGQSGPEVMANARLIAAAPDLLAALRRCVRDGDLPMGADADAWIAIRKAEGA